MYGEHVLGLESISLSGCKKRPRLLGIQGSNLLLLRSWGFDAFGHVARNESIGHGVLQGLVQRRVDVSHRAAAKSRFQLLTVKSAYVGGGEGLELDAPQGRLDVDPDYGLVALPCPLPDRAVNVGQPTVEVLAHLQATRVEGQPLCAIAKGVRQLARYLLARPAVQGSSLRSRRSVDRVTRFPTPILALRYGPLAVAPLLAHSSAPPLSTREPTMLQQSINTTSI